MTVDWWKYRGSTEEIVDCITKRLHPPHYTSAALIMEVRDQTTLQRTIELLRERRLITEEDAMRASCLDDVLGKPLFLPMPQQSLTASRKRYVTLIRELIALGVVREIRQSSHYPE